MPILIALALGGLVGGGAFFALDRFLGARIGGSGGTQSVLAGVAVGMILVVGLQAFVGRRKR